MNFDLYQVGREYALENANEILTSAPDLFIPKALRAAAKTADGAASLEAGIAGVPVWTEQSDNVREGKMLIFGCPFHVCLIRVDENYNSVGGEYQRLIDHMRIPGARQRLVDDHWFPVITPFLA